ncbi:restriction endonuclease subunit S [Enterococcus faecalis]|nr:MULTISPECIES: restriction endonuclease subunit S [Enterococcus]EGO7776775.1 restriction endonuclease subunit S [Enterococcus faecalis]EGO7817015.1 restriction endonuclease subunit S [Enterococcus faecalis]EGO7989047.1 restriction endonuclease subunit S [Enterococcus faecalis]EGO8277538.1 restriction endonuclease subunit S [Enterococcus faecalis]EGO8398344.1 restriction endonuclease subunit S [Enterococcus faecalis]
MVRKKIEDLGKVISGGTPSTKNERYWGGDIAWITPKDLSKHNSMFIFKGERGITEEGLKNSSAYTVPTGTVLFSSRAPIGYVAIAGKNLTTNQGFKNIVVNDENDNLFIYYLLKNNIKFIESHANGSTFKEISAKVFKNLEFDVPNLDTQRKISKILSTLDSKIELNNQIISNLEELASTLFKRWFVDFDFPNENGNPYKSSGGKMIDSKLGEIPEGWHVDTISNLMENFDRKRVPLSKMQREKRNGVYPYYGAASLIAYVDDFLFDGTYLLLGEDGTVITKEGNPVLQYVRGKFWVNNHAHVLKGKGYVSTEWLYLWFKQTNVSGIVTGAVQPKISQTNLNRLKVVSPDKEQLIKFQKNIGIIFNKLVVLSNEITILTELRDLLLPKLLSGEVEFPEDEEV